jgi:hypothetical protein
MHADVFISTGMTSSDAVSPKHVMLFATRLLSCCAKTGPRACLQTSRFDVSGH